MENCLLIYPGADGAESHQAAKQIMAMYLRFAKHPVSVRWHVMGGWELEFHPEDFEKIKDEDGVHTITQTGFMDEKGRRVTSFTTVLSSERPNIHPFTLPRRRYTLFPYECVRDSILGKETNACFEVLQGNLSLLWEGKDISAGSEEDV